VFEADGKPINAASILPRLLRDFGDIAAVIAAIAPRPMLAAAPTAKPDRPLTNLDQSDKRFTSDAQVLIDWLKR
jgi:hypothetical protein